MMATIMVTTRLSPRLALALDQLADRLDWSLGTTVEALLRRSEALRQEILKISVPGPLTEKRNLRLSPQAIDQLRGLAGETLEPSVFIRHMLACFLSDPRALQLAFPHVLGEGEAPLLGEDEGAAPVRAIPVPVGGSSWVGVLILLAVILVPLVLAVVMSFLNPPPPPPARPSGERPRTPTGDDDRGGGRSPQTENGHKPDSGHSS